MARKKGSTDYAIETKLEAVRLRDVDGLSYKDITKRLAIRDPNRVKAWMRIYRKEGAARLKKARRGRPRKDRNGLEAWIKQLEMENTLLKALAIELGEELPKGLDIGPSTNTEGNSK